MNVGSELKKLGLKAAYNYLDRDPETNMPKLMEWVDKFVKEDVLTLQREVFRKIIAEKNSNWSQLLASFWQDIDGDVRKTLFENLVINANALAALQARESEEKYHCNIPWAVAFDLGETEEGASLSFDQLDNIMEQAKELGTFMFLLTGREPLERKEEVIALCNKHTDCQFMVFTNGLAIDEDFADQALRVKNFIGAIHVTGRTEDLRLDSIFALLKAKKLPYGVYCTYDKSDAEDFAQESFFDDIISRGAKFCWFFSSLKREEDRVYALTKMYRELKPLLTINFCKDTVMTGGCIAGRYYCSLSADGRIKPCSFLSCPGVDLKEQSLLSAYQADCFMEYYKRKPTCRGVFE